MPNSFEYTDGENSFSILKYICLLTIMITFAMTLIIIAIQYSDSLNMYKSFFGLFVVAVILEFYSLGLMQTSPKEIMTIKLARLGVHLLSCCLLITLHSLLYYNPNNPASSSLQILSAISTVLLLISGGIDIYWF